MSITLNITADNGPELRNVLRCLLNDSVAPTKSAVAPASPEKAPVSEPAESAAPAVDGPTPPAKEEKKGKGKKAAKEEAAPAAASEDVPVTLDGCRMMAKKVAASDGKNGEAGGTDKAIKIITGFGVEGLKTLPEEKYQAFIDECKKQLLVPMAAPAPANTAKDVFA